MALRVEMTGNSTGFKQMLEASKAHARKFSDDLDASITKTWGGGLRSIVGGIAGAFSFGVVKNAIEDVFNEAGRIKDMAEQFDLGAESVQKWEKALKLAGVSTQTFATALDQLRVKRAAAMEDPNNLEPFTALGVGTKALDPNVTDEELLRAILGSGGSRVRMREILGKGGPRLKGALSDLDASAPMSEREIENLDKTDKAYTRAKLGAGEAVRGSISGLIALFRSQTWKDLFTDEQTLLNRRMAEDSKRKTDTDSQAKADANEIELDRQFKEQEAFNKTKEEQDRKLNAAQKKFDESRLKNATEAERRAAKEARVKELEDSIAYDEAAGPDMMSPAEKERLLQNKIEREELLFDLKKKEKGGPLSFSADSLAKVGLYTGSSITYNPIIGVQQEQLRELREIRVELRRRLAW